MTADKRVMRVAVCDDERALCSDFEIWLKAIAYRMNMRIEVDIWFSGEGLRDYLSKGNHIDVIFLDIELERMSGIDIGYYIRDRMGDIRTQIIYISSKTNYALQLFKTQPFDFMVKPITQEQLEDVIKRVRKVLQSQNDMFEYQNGREQYWILYDDIVYFKSDLHKIIIVMKDGEREYYGKLKDVIGSMPPQFLVIHKSYIINRNYVNKYKFDRVEMRNGAVLSISKAYQKEIREKLSLMRRDRKS